MHRTGLPHRQQNGLFSQQGRVSTPVNNNTQPSRGSGSSKARSNAPSSGFSQLVRMNQGRGSIDLSEFPQLSTGPRPTNNAVIWSNPAIRAPPISGQKGLGKDQGHDPGSHPAGSDNTWTQPTVNPSSENYRFGSRPDPRTTAQQAPQANPLSASQALPVGNDDFPPLTGLGSTAELQREKKVLVQTVPGLGAATQAPEPRQTPGSFGRANRTRETEQSVQTSQPEQESETTDPVEAGASETGHAKTISQVTTESHRTTSQILAAMPERDRFSMQGLSVTMENAENYRSHNLASFGFDMDRANHTPLHLTFGSLFSDPRRNVPEFHLPAAYNVTNVPPLDKRMSTFSEDTLFAIFYQYPRDILQELAAVELYNRDWRWHKELKRWLRKGSDLPSPVIVSTREERGFYIVFEVDQWQKVPRELLINYSHLETR